MDTRWKRNRARISFLLFFVGASLSVGWLAGLGQEFVREGASPEALERRIEEAGSADYQQSEAFRLFIEAQMNVFLAMAAGENIFAYTGLNESQAGFSTEDPRLEELLYGESGTRGTGTAVAFADGVGAVDRAEEITTGDLEPEETEGSPQDGSEPEKEGSEPLISWAWWIEEDAWEEYLNSGDYTAEQRRLILQARDMLEQDWRNWAEQYHRQIEGDENLLYRICYDGRVLYSNTNELHFDEKNGRLTAPEDYNFILYFDGENTHIAKDGVMEDVYGNGYYRPGRKWFVPGYVNYRAQEKYRPVEIYMAAARRPVQISGKSTFYLMRQEILKYRDQDNLWAGLAALGLALLFISFLIKKGRKEANCRIAALTGKIWVECKTFFLLAALGASWRLLAYLRREGYDRYDLRDLFGRDHTFYYINGIRLEELSGGLCWFTGLSLFCVVWFWIGYLVWNDLYHNRKKVWKCGVIAKLYRAFRAKELNTPLAKRLSRRAGLLAVACLGMGAIAAGVLLFRARDLLIRRNVAEALSLIPVAYLLAAALFAAVVCCYADMRNARDLELLTARIGEIYRGDYGADAAERGIAPGHDLYQAMTELEDIRAGMARAIAEQTKSQRMKVELIANVSHDLKTPLTSIISYVQLLKQEEELPEYVKDYIRILDKKSERLNAMVQDVFAVSKAASGELPVNMEVLDFGKLLRQTMADMQEEIQESGLTFRVTLPEEPVRILADGKRMYRVFQNLFQNAIRYSLDGSRVYVTMSREDGRVSAAVKNTSREELNADTDFTERFVRGDVSRTDGGSGLGLSIARSFTEACGGEFALETIADLFIVTVSFREEDAPDEGDAPGEGTLNEDVPDEGALKEDAPGEGARFE